MRHRKRSASSDVVIIEEKKPHLQPKSVNDLSKKILAKIFSLLDLVSVEAAAATCRRWRKVVEANRDFDLRMFDKTSYTESQALSRSRRRYTELIYSLEKPRNRPLPYQTFTVAINNLPQLMRDTIKKFVFSISNKAISLDILNTLVNVFMQLPHLKDIKMLNVHGPMIDALDVSKKPKFTDLEHLVFEDCDIKLLSFFSKAQLQLLGVHTPVNCQPSSQKLFWDFLSTQNRLETIDTAFSKQFGVNYLFRSPFRAVINFELNEFSMRAVRLSSKSDFENILIFLELHAHTLKALELGQKFPDFIYNFVFSKLQKLETLYVMANDVPDSEEFFSKLRDSKSIKNLLLSHHVNAGKCNENSIKLIRHLPNLKDLSLLMPYNKKVHQLIVDNSKKLKNLKKMFIELPWYVDLAHVELPPIEMVEIHCSEEMPKLAAKKKAPVNEQLRSLHFYGEVDKDFCEIVKRCYPNLTNLEISKKDVHVDHSMLPNVRELRFRDESFFEKDDIFYEDEYLEDFAEIEGRDSEDD